MGSQTRFMFRQGRSMTTCGYGAYRPEKRQTAVMIDRCWRVLLLALLIFLSLIPLPVEPHLQAQAACPSTGVLSRFGINEVLGWPGLYPPDRMEHAVGLMAQAGMGWVRLNWAWKDLQP